MASRERSTWPLVLFAGLCGSALVGGAVAVAEPSDSGRPMWNETAPQRVTGTVVSVDESDGTIVLDGLVSYDPPRAGIGTLVIEVAELGEVRADDTVDVIVTRSNGRWKADELLLLDPD